MHGVIRCRAHPRQHRIVAGDTEQPETYDEQAGYRAAAKSDVECRIHAQGGGLGSADIGAHGNIHPNVAGKTGE